MKFTKMHGIGNDYVYVNCFKETVKDPSAVAKFVSDRHFGMFLAVIIPPSKKNKAVLLVVLGAMAVSALFAWVPVLSKVSSGFVIIITTILVAGLAAWLCPVDEENAKEEAHEA